MTIQSSRAARDVRYATASLIFLAALFLSGKASAVDAIGPCLSQAEVHAGYPRYHVVGGRHCWYASPDGPPAKSGETKHDPVARTGKIDVNPYDDPIWRESDVADAQRKRRPTPARANPDTAVIDVNPYDDPIWQEPNATR